MRVLHHSALDFALTSCTLWGATTGIFLLTMNGASKHEKRSIWGQHIRGQFTSIHCAKGQRVYTALQH